MSYADPDAPLHHRPRHHPTQQRYPEAVAQARADFTTLQPDTQ
jgi:hypothetical protein